MPAPPGQRETSGESAHAARYQTFESPSVEFPHQRLHTGPHKIDHFHSVAVAHPRLQQVGLDPLEDLPSAESRHRQNMEICE